MEKDELQAVDRNYCRRRARMFFFIIKREGRKTIVVEVYTVGSSCIFDTTTLKIESWQL